MQEASYFSEACKKIIALVKLRKKTVGLLVKIELKTRRVIPSALCYNTFEERCAPRREDWANVDRASAQLG